MGNFMGRGMQSQVPAPGETLQELQIGGGNEVPPSQRQWYKRYRHADPEHTDTPKAAVLAKEFMEELPIASHPVPPPGLWAVPAFMPNVHDALTAEMVEKAEKQLGVKLPSMLLQIFKQQHGGPLRKSTAGTFSEFYGLSDDAYKPSMIHSVQWQRWHELQERIDQGENVDDWDLEWPPEQWKLLVPIAGDDCHFYYCLDYRRCGPTGDPRITYLDIELESDFEIAMSLKAWLQHCEVEVLRHEEGSALKLALVKQPGNLKAFMVELVQLLKEEGGGLWMKLPNTVEVVTGTNREHCGAAESAVCKATDHSAWLQAYSVLSHKESSWGSTHEVVCSGPLIHTFPEHPEATHVIRGPAKVMDRVLEVLAATPGVLVFPPSPPAPDGVDSA